MKMSDDWFIWNSNLNTNFKQTDMQTHSQSAISNNKNYIYYKELKIFQDF